MFSIAKAMELAAFVGIPVMDFWEMTLAELNIYLIAHNKRLKIERQNSVTNAFLTSRWVWAKKITEEDFRKALGEEKTKKVMTDEMMANQVKALNKLFGGEVKHIG